MQVQNTKYIRSVGEKMKIEYKFVFFKRMSLMLKQKLFPFQEGKISSWLIPNNVHN